MNIIQLRRLSDITSSPSEYAITMQCGESERPLPLWPQGFGHNLPFDQNYFVICLSIYMVQSLLVFELLTI